MSDETPTHVPPSQQSAQGPVAKPGEPVDLEAYNVAKDKARAKTAAKVEPTVAFVPKAVPPAPPAPKAAPKKED
jgi:hypothetical protein